MILILFYWNPSKAKTVLFEIFWDIFCQSSALVNDGFFRKQLFNRLDFSRFLLFSTFSVARCQGPQNSVWIPECILSIALIIPGHFYAVEIEYILIQFNSFLLYMSTFFSFCKRVFFANIQNWPDRVTNILDY